MRTAPSHLASDEARQAIQLSLSFFQPPNETAFHTLRWCAYQITIYCFVVFPNVASSKNSRSICLQKRCSSVSHPCCISANLLGHQKKKWKWEVLSDFHFVVTNPTLKGGGAAGGWGGEEILLVLVLVTYLPINLLKGYTWQPFLRGIYLDWTASLAIAIAQRSDDLWPRKPKTKFMERMQIRGSKNIKNHYG